MSVSLFLLLLLLLLSHRWQPPRLPRPWDSPGKNTGVGCHFLLQGMKVKSESEVAQSCPTLSDLTDCSLPGSSIHGIFQARVLEWGAIAFSSFPITLIQNFTSGLLRICPLPPSLSSILSLFLQCSFRQNLNLLFFSLTLTSTAFIFLLK